MLLTDILKILAVQTQGLGYRRTDLYEKLFQNLLDENCFSLEDIVKQIFSGSRSLNSSLMRTLCEPDGFHRLCDNIQNNFLNVVGNHGDLYEQLCTLLITCPYMKKEDVEKLISACDPAQTAELSRFIAACIV